MRNLRLWLTVGALSLLVLSGCSGVDPAGVLARHFGARAGASLAAALPPPLASTTVSTDAICRVLVALGGPVSTAGTMDRRTLEFLVAFDETGVDLGCWLRPPT